MCCSPYKTAEELRVMKERLEEDKKKEEELQQRLKSSEYMKFLRENMG